MENRSLSVVAGLIALWAMPLVAGAAEMVANPEQQAAWEQRLDQAEALQAQGKARQAEADRLYKQESDACQLKLLVNDCRNKARQIHLNTIREARQLEIDGKNMAREVKAEQVAERQRQQAEEAPRRAAELQARQAETTAARQAAEDNIEATRAAKATRAAEGQKRKAAEAENHRRKVAEHEAKVAAKVDKAQHRKAKAVPGE